MIRVLFVGKEAADWAARLEEASGVEVVSARLPAAAIRSFEQTPADAVVLVSKAVDRRMVSVVDAIRARPLGSVTPLVALASEPEEEDLRDRVDAWLGEVEPSELLDAIAEQLELEPSELEMPEFPMPRRSASTASVTTPPEDVELDATAVERKLRQVRHESYFAILDVEPQASFAAIRDAFETLRRRYSPDKVPDDVARRYTAELDEIRDAIEDAWAVLGNDTLRGRYAEAALSN